MTNTVKPPVCSHCHQIIEPITDEMIDNVMIAALEGGITYWCSMATLKGACAAYEDGSVSLAGVLTKGGVIVLHDFVDPKKRVVTKDKLVNGIRLEAARSGKTISQWYKDHDAGGADNAVQMGIFEELMYG